MQNETRSGCRQLSAFIIATATLFLLSQNLSHAQVTLNWDPGLSDTSTGGGAGTWTTGTANWYNGTADVAYTNTEAIAATLHALEQRLAHLRENLRTPELRDEFDLANRFRKS